MCDYSLAEVPNRLAATGELLVVHRFSTGTIGLKSFHRRLREVLLPARTVAVCIPPGARLALQDIPKNLQNQLSVAPVETVTFIQRTLEANVHRDGIRFANGREILLQQLTPGQRATVLSLDSEEEKVSLPSDNHADASI
jgi:hypothetical protein